MSMTLEQVRDWHLARAREQRNIGCSVGVENHKGMADAIDAHLAQPAQLVDVEKVPTGFVEDIQRAERLAMKSKKLNRERMMGLAVVKHFGHLLTAALQEKGKQ